MVRGVHRKNVFPRGGVAWYLLHQLQATRPFESVVDDRYPLRVFVVVHAAIVVRHHDDIVDIAHGGLDVRCPNLREQLTVDVHLVRCPVLFDCHDGMVGYSVQTRTQGGGCGLKSEPEAEVRGGERGIRDPRDHKWTRFGTRKKISWVTNAELNYTVTLLLFRPNTPPGFRCCRLFRCSTCLLRSFGLASLNQFVTGELVHGFLLLIVIVIIRDDVVVLVLKLGCAFVMIDPPTHIMGLLEIRGRFCSKLLRELAQILRFVERHRVLPGVIPRKDEYRK
jgi:hypothetical protein